MKELETVGEDSRTVGFQTKGLGDVLQGGGTCGTSIWVGGVDADPPHGMGPGKPPSQGLKSDNGETAKDTGGGGMVIPTAGGNGGRGSI